MVGQTDEQMGQEDGQRTNGQTDKGQMDRRTNGQMDRHMDRITDRWTNEQMDGTGRYVQTQNTDIWIDGQSREMDERT